LSAKFRLLIFLFNTQSRFFSLLSADTIDKSCRSIIANKFHKLQTDLLGEFPKEQNFKSEICVGFVRSLFSHWLVDDLIKR